jgi:formate hydrogenlyase subunit 3/multisubunit Na+/H+ antiporter MnhD subunit
MSLMVLLILIPMIGGAAAFASKKWAQSIALLASIAVFALTLFVFASPLSSSAFLHLSSSALSAGIFAAVSLISLLVIVYSGGWMRGHERMNEYYSYILFTLGAAAGVLFSSDLLMLLMFWGMTGITLYMLIGIGGPKATYAAQKSLIIVGGSDAILILGIGLVLSLTQTLQIGATRIPIEGAPAALAFICFVIAAFAKAGAMPFHSWVTDSSETAPVPVMAFLPASIDKFLGIYLLFRICNDIFILTPGSLPSLVLMAAGSLTLILAVTAALLQHDIKKLLAFHAVSQVGYMVIGIGSATPIGIAGGLFHMFNNAIYKSCLFLSAGSVEKQTGSTSVDKLGGLSDAMPFTFISAAVAALSISGIPPLNGFVSKWMIYQGIINLMPFGPLWVLWLLAAMFGSALTLASFIKLIYAVFLGQKGANSKNIHECPPAMWIPGAILAAICVIFGLLAFIPIKYIILPSTPLLSIIGSFDPILAALLLIVGLIAGAGVYMLHVKIPAVSTKPYIGGETIPEDITKVSGGEFYNTIKEYGPIDAISRVAEKKYLDLYDTTIFACMKVNKFLSSLYDGFLGNYISWMLIGGVLVWLILSI